MRLMISDVLRLYGDWLNLEWSKEKILIAAIALPVLLIGASNLPLILFAVGLWVMYSYTLSVLRLCVTSLWTVVFRKVLPTGSGRSRSKSGIVGLLGGSDSTASAVDTPIPGKRGLPFVGETLSYVSNPSGFLAEKRALYGDVFSANIDFSGTFLAARRVVFLFHSSALQTERPQGTRTSAMASYSPSRGVAGGSRVTGAGSPQRRHSPSKASLASPARPAALIPAVLADGAGPPSAARLGRKLQVLGLYGPSCHGGDLHRRCLSLLAERVLGQHRYLDAWEDAATPIIQAFLRRLIYDNAPFSLADRVNELACELVGSIFLGIPGFSPSLLAALDGYLASAQQNPAFNASLAHRKQLSACIHVAMFEEDRRFFAKDWREFDADTEYPAGGEGGDARSVGMLGELMELCADILHQENPRERAHSSDDAAAASKRDALQQDLVFVFVVEVVYLTLVRQLRALAESITRESTPPVEQHQGSGVKSVDTCAAGSVPAGPAACRDSYAAYLSARQLVGNLSGSGLARFSWASTIYPEDGDELEEGEEVTGGVHLPSQQGVCATTDTGVHPQEPKPVPPEPVEIGARSSIGSYLLSQLSWPLSPAIAASAQGIAALHEPLQDYAPPSRPLRSHGVPTLSSRAVRNHPPASASLREGTVLPVAQFCDAGFSTSDSELAYSSSPSAGRPPAVRTAFLGHLSTAVVEPQSTPAVMQNVGRRGIPQVTPSAQQTPASSASWKRPSSSLSRSGTGGKRRYDGRFGYRSTSTPNMAAGKGYSVVTPSRSVMRSRGDSVSDSSPGAFLRSPEVGTPHSIVTAAGSHSVGRGRKGAVAMTPGSEAGCSAGAGTPNKTSWRYRERLIIRYVTSVKELVATCKERVASAPSQQQHTVNSTLSQCKQSCEVQYTPPADPASTPVQYTINKGDLLVRVFPADADIVERVDSGHPAPVPASRDLGAFSDLVLAIFTHELVTGFEWDGAVDAVAGTTSSAIHGSAQAGPLRAPRSYQVLHRDAPLSATQSALQLVASIAATLLPPTKPLPTATPGASPLPNQDSGCAHSAGLIKKFRVRPDSIAFLISTRHCDGLEGSDGEVGDGMGGPRRALMRGWLDAQEGEDDDARYYSDGL